MGSGSETNDIDAKLSALIEQMPDKPPRSKLEPHLDVIRALRYKRRTYQEIAHFLAEHVNLKVSPSTIHAFVRCRARRRQKPPEMELPPAASSNIETPTAEETITPGIETDVRSRIEALKQRRSSEKSKTSRFEYNADEPLRLVPGSQQQE